MHTSSRSRLIASAMMLMASCALFVGLTFAWFTDSVANKGNAINAGKLSVVLQKDLMDDGSEGWSNVAEAEPVFQDFTFEPGKSAAVKLRVVNTGTLAIKYELRFTNVQATGGIDQRLEVYLVPSSVANPGELLTETNKIGTLANLVADGKPIATDSVLAPSSTSEPAIGEIGCLVIKLPENAGNAYQGGNVTFDLELVTTQAASEANGFGDNQYDAGALVNKESTVSTSDDLNGILSEFDAADGALKAYRITLGNNLECNGIKNANSGSRLVVDLNGKTLSAAQSVGQGALRNGMWFAQGTTNVIKNGTFGFSSNNSHAKCLIQNYSNLTLRDVNLDASQVSGLDWAVSSNCGTVLIAGNTNIIAPANSIALDVMHYHNAAYMSEGSHVVIDDTMSGTIDGKIKVYCSDSENRPVTDRGATLVIMGGTFKNSGLTLDEFRAFVPEGYTVTQVDDGSFQVNKAS